MAESQGNSAPGALQGNGTPGAADEKKYVTEEQLNEIVNRAITGRFKTFETKLEKTLTDVVGGISGKLEELAKPKVEEPKPDERAKSRDLELENSPLVRGLKKQVDELNSKMRTAEEEKQAIKAQSRNVGMRNTVSEALVKLGVDAGRAKHAVAFLIDAEKRARYSADDTDEIVFRDSDNQEVDLNTGLKSWMKSDDAKIYMPPRGTSGSGARPVGKTQDASGNNQQPALGEKLRDFFVNE